MAEYIRYDFLPTGFRNTGAYLTLREAPVLTINLQHGISSLKSREIATQYSTGDIVLSGFINDVNKQNLIIAKQNTNTLANFNLQSPVETTVNLFASTKRIRAFYFNEHYFLHAWYPQIDVNLYRIDSSNTLATNPYTYTTGFSPLLTANVYANRVYIADLNEPFINYSNNLAISGTLNAMDLKGIASNAPFVCIEDLSLQDVGSFKTFFTAIQLDGTTVIYSGKDFALDFSLQYRYQIPAFLPYIYPVKIGADLLVFTQEGMFSLKALLQSSGAELYELNLFEAILPLWRTLYPYATSAELVKSWNSVAIFFRKTLNEVTPFRIRPNSVLGEQDKFKVVDGYSVLLYNLVTRAISFYSYPFPTTGTLGTKTIQKELRPIEYGGDVYLAECYYNDI